MQCKCKNDKKVKKITGFGCAKGGFPWCQNTVDHSLFCKNGDTVFLDDLAQYTIEGRSGCVCRDGIEPRCKTTGDVVVCPDGSHVDYKLGNPGAYLDGCSNKPWKF